MADVWEKDLAQKTSLTTSDYIRVVGSDNVSYKQVMTSVKDTLGVTTLENRLKYGLLNSGTHDADNFEHLSSYMCHKSYVSNLPLDFNGNYVFVETYRSRLGWNTTSSSSNYTHQIATGYTDGDCYVRIKRDAGWSAWEKQPTRAEVDALSAKLTNTAPGLNVSDFITLETGWSMSIARYVVYGNIISLEVLITPPSAIASGALAKVGVVKSGYRPTAMTPLGGGSFSGYIWTDGDFRVRNITANTISNQQRIGLIYLKA